MTGGEPGLPPLRGTVLAVTLALVAGSSLALALPRAALEVRSGPGGLFGNDTRPVFLLVDGRGATPLRRNFVTSDRKIMGVAARPRGGWILASSDGVLAAFDSRGEQSRAWVGPRGARSFLRLGDGDRYALPGSGGQVGILDATSGELRLAGGQEGWLWNAAASPDGSRIVTACREGTVALRDGNGTVLRFLPGHDGPLTDMVFSPAGNSCLGIDREGRIHVWSRDGVEVALLQPGDGGAKRAMFPDDSGVVVATAGGTLLHFELDGGARTDLPQPGSVVSAMASGSDGAFLIGTLAGRLLEFQPDRDSAPGRTWRSIERRGHRGTIGFLCPLPGSDGRLLSAAADRTLRFWDADGTERASLHGIAPWTSALALSDDGQSLAVVFKSDQRSAPLLLNLGFLPPPK